MAGQIRIRIRHKKMKTPYFDYLLVSPDEMRDLLHGKGWKLSKIFNPGIFPYTVVIEKEQLFQVDHEHRAKLIMDNIYPITDN